MTSKYKVFIIAPRELYPYINDSLNKIVDGKISPLLPYDFEHSNYIDGIISNLAKKHLIKSHDYIMSLPDADLFSYEEIEYLRDLEAYNRGYQDWLMKKFEYSKKQIDDCHLCLIFNSNDIPLDDIVKKEIKNEIKFATNKYKAIKTINIDPIQEKDKKISLYNDKLAV
jgi:hypothetical protein